MSQFMSRPESEADKEAALGSKISKLARALPGAKYADLTITLLPQDGLTGADAESLRTPIVRVYFA